MIVPLSQRLGIVVDVPTPKTIWNTISINGVSIEVDSSNSLNQFRNTDDTVRNVK